MDTAGTSETHLATLKHFPAWDNSREAQSNNDMKSMPLQSAHGL
jgi:hypothetical protein